MRGAAEPGWPGWAGAAPSLPVEYQRTGKRAVMGESLDYLAAPQIRPQRFVPKCSKIQTTKSDILKKSKSLKSKEYQWTGKRAVMGGSLDYLAVPQIRP